MPNLLNTLIQLIAHFFSSLELGFLRFSQPFDHALDCSIVTDLTRSKTELSAENAFLRQQLIVLHRQVKKPIFTQSNRLWLVLLASRIRNWKEALLILKPDALLRWKRQGFRLFWKFKSRDRGGRPRLSSETITLIQQMAKENLLWGAERIHGELHKNGVQVAKATIQKYVRPIRPRQASSQNWFTFVKNHAKDVWACDFPSSTSSFTRFTRSSSSS